MNKITQKLVFLAILILTLTFTAVFAEPVVIKEDFSIRGGITFLMSASDIKHIEQENKSSVNDWISDYLVAKSNLCYDITLAGESASVAYWLDSDKCLDEMQYLLFSSSHYNEVKSSLVNKYGSPYFLNEAPIISTNRFFLYDEFRILNTVIKDYAGWLVQYNDCYVLIETSQIYLPSAGTLGYVTYHPLSYEELASYQLIQDTLDDSKQQSINDDL